MSEPKLVRTMTTIRCPHCDKLAVVSIRSNAPSVDWTLRPEDVEKSKLKVLKGLDEIEFTDQKKKAEILEYLASPETFIGPDEVDPFLTEVILDNKPQNDIKKD